MNQTHEAQSAGGQPSPRAEVRARVAHESYRRARLGVPALAGGVLYLLGGIIVSEALKLLPTVGVIQGLAPALRGEANPAVSPGATEVRFISHHAFGLIVGNVLQALGVSLLLAVLLFVFGAVRFRRPETGQAGRLLVLGGGALTVLTAVVHPVAQALNAHKFATGHVFTAQAVNHALSRGALLETSEYLGLLGGLVLAVGMVIVVLGALRTGIIPRWMTYLGVVVAVLAFTPFGLALGTAQQLISAFWMVAMGLLLMGRWPGGDPPAWAAGEARPWPTQTQMRSEQLARKGKGSRAGKLAHPSMVAEGTEVTPAPAQPAGANSRRRRKRGNRR
jgi:hypothetical protein